MKVTRMAAATTTVAALALVGSVPAQAVADRARKPTVAAITPTRVVIAVTGTNGRLYSRKTNEGFRNLGGMVRDAPAVAYSASTGRVYYVVKGSDNALYVRTDTTGFTRLGASCLYGPAAAVFETRFVAACIGSNHALYYASATLGPGNPVVSGWVNQGGYATQGPAVYFRGTDTPSFMVVGPDDFPGYAGFNVYSRSAVDPVGGYRAEYVSCIAQPEVVGDAAPYANHSFLGCRNGGAYEGTPGQLYYEWNDRYGGGGYQADGVIVGRVGIAAATDNAGALFYVTATNGYVYSKPVALGYDVQTTGYSVVGCCALPGVAAASMD